MATCFLRIIVSKDPIQNDKGTYDLRITKNFSLDSGMNTVTNPVFSYRSDGKLYIFSADNQKKSCTYQTNGNYDLWEWEFPRNSKGEVVQVTDTQLTNFRDYISEIVDTYSWNSAMKCYVCTLKSSHGSFEMGTQDSYKETAEWCKKLGSAALLNRFNDVDGTKYQATLPAALRLKYKALGSWVKIDDGYDLPQS